jgi:hypothetical protein
MMMLVKYLLMILEWWCVSYNDTAWWSTIYDKDIQQWYWWYTSYNEDYKNSNKMVYYLFKKFLVSDWLTANCEIVISTQWLTKYGFFTFILAKWRQRVNMKKIWTRLRHITMTTRIILTRWRHWYDATTAAEGLRNCFFLNANKIQMFVLNFLNK